MIDTSAGQMFPERDIWIWINPPVAGCDRIWLSLVDSVRKGHSRKYSFIGDFEEIAAGNRPELPESFEKRARKRWKKQISK